MNDTANSNKHFAKGFNVGRSIARSTDAVVDGVCSFGRGFKWLGREVAKDARAVGSAVNNFAAGVKFGMLAYKE